MGVEQLVGLILTGIDRSDDELVFREESGRKFRMYHSQDCCETVQIEDLCGDLRDLVGVPILYAEEAASENPPEGKENGCESNTWTFYKFRTINGSVDIRWHGESNGYYSESVDFEEIKP
jgi:hypothetical protein